VALSSTDRLLRRTRRRLFAVTLGLLTLLVVGVGAATVVVATSALDADLDRALEAAVRAQVAALDGELPGGEEQTEAVEHSPAVADTVLLVLDANGRVRLNRTGQTLPGLPDAGALGGAARGLDIRTVDTSGVEVRVLTMPVLQDGVTAGFVQGGFDLRLHDQQSRSLMLAVLVVGALGLVGAAAIAYVVTGRALVPIREGFEAQRRFVADASHELRTPAALIRANAEVLERENLVTGDGSALVSDIIGEADRLGGLVGDLLQLAAWDETTLTLSPVALDLASLASDTVRGATALAAERAVGLEVDVTGPAPAIADRDRLVQLLLILVDNAIDHSPSGETVTVRVRTAGGNVVIDVDDRGPGIPPAERERIFEPFTRLSGTTRHGSGGTGLGLAIARRIVDAHGGTLRADSPAGGGARFTATLPGPDEGTPTVTTG
jgi:two-component system, OmpR family, sensor histidine kinase CiaH